MVRAMGHAWVLRKVLVDVTCDGLNASLSVLLILALPMFV
jgi:hypothetical protein